MAWLLRVQIVEAGIARYCDQRGLTCEADVSAVYLNSTEISALSITSNGRQALTTQDIRVAFSWPAWFRPQLEEASIDSPVISAGFDGAALDFRELERLMTGGSGGEPAKIAIMNGRIEMETPAGDLTAALDITGKLPRDGQAYIVADPAQLQSGTDQLSLTKGAAHLTIANGQVTGTADFQIANAKLGELSIQNAAFKASLEGADRAPAIGWSGGASYLSLGANSLTGVSTSGEAHLSGLPNGGAASALDLLLDVAGELSAESVNIGGFGSETMSLTADLLRDGNKIKGAMGLSAASFSSRSVYAERASASGRVEFDANNFQNFSFSGSSIVEGAGTQPSLRADWLNSVRLPAPFSAHGNALRAALDDALSNFDSGADIDVRRMDGEWRVRASRPTAIRAASGMTMSVEPDFGKHWLELSHAGASLSGEVIITGGGAPEIRTSISSAARRADRLNITATPLQIAPWTVDGRTLGVSLVKFDMASAPEGLRVSAAGDVEIAGGFAGTELRRTSLSGGFEATRGREGWRVQTERGGCLDLASEGLSSGALKLEPTALNLCPEDGRFVRQENGMPTGKLSLGDVALSFSTIGSSGILSLENSALDWSLDDALYVSLSGDALSLPLELRSGLVTIDGETPALRLTAGNGPIRIFASMRTSEFGGDIIPAKVSAAGFSFTGQASDTGLGGLLRSEDVRIEDYRDDPLYEPLRADLTATIDDGRFRMSGPLRLLRTGWTIADSSLNLGLGDLNGTGKLTGRTLTFTPNGLQPHDLSDRLRSALPNARGSMVGNADFTITNGKIAGTGQVTVQNFGFDTFRVGAIDGVNGRVEFSDIINLTTRPKQVVRIASIDPGVRLQNGEIGFQLFEGERLELQSARWPFAGGDIVIAPTRWQLGGETELIRINANKIKLGELITALALEKEFQADGTVSGSFPIEIIGPNAFIRGATLKADQSGGTLAYFGKGLDAAKGQSEASDYALDALKNFKFKVLEVGANGNISGRIVVSIVLEGTSPDVLDGAPFRFNMNFDSKLAQLIRSIQSGASATAGTRFIQQIIADATEGENAPEE